MNILYSWIKEFVDIQLSPDDLAERLTMAGIETSSVIYLGEGFERIVTGKINAIQEHPKGDKLSLCIVTDGQRDYQIVCGARNIAVGDIVPLALTGAHLPSGIEIRKAKIRGYDSEGMMCSEKELGISDDHEGIMILPQGTNPGSSIVDTLFLDDYLMEMEITPNRGDCLSIFGIAREIAAICGIPIKKPPVSIPETEKGVDEEVSISIEDYDLCPRYSSRVIYDVRITSSPFWLQRRLQVCGVRPINNVVDITNYLLLEVGQPMHAFDLDLIEENKIVVKCAGDLKTFTTLDGIERALSEDMLLIWDGMKPVAIAGIMGGGNTEVSKETRRVLFESAHFNPLSIRKSRTRLGMSTESSYRFERGVDPTGTLFAIDRAITIMADCTEFKLVGGAIDERGNIPEFKPVPFRPVRAGKILGRKVRENDAVQIFLNLGFEIGSGNEDEITVNVPSYRFDITREIDLIEEVARIEGYEKIPTTYPKADSPHPSKDHAFLEWKKRAASYLSALGVMESIHYAFMSDRIYEKLSPYSEDFKGKPIALENPITEETRNLRPSLLPGLLRSINMNISRYNRNIRLFEVGKVFNRSLAFDLFEENRLGVALTGSIPGVTISGEERTIDFFFAKSILSNLLTSLGFYDIHLIPEKTPGLYHPKKSAAIKYGDITMGYIGEINVSVAELFDISQEVLYFELSLDRLYSEKIGVRKFKEISKFPPVERDISFIVDFLIPIGDVVEYAKRVDDSLIQHVSVFDVYESEKIGQDKKSVGLRIIYQSLNRTLTEQEVNDIHKKIIRLIENRFGGKVRSS